MSFDCDDIVNVTWPRLTQKEDFYSLIKHIMQNVDLIFHLRQ